MFGCLRRLTSLVVLAAVAAGLYLFRDTWYPRARAMLAAAKAAPVPGDSASASPADTGWTVLTFGRAERGRAALSKLQARGGPAFVSIDPAELASAWMDSLSTQLPQSADSLQVKVQGSELLLSARVRLGDLGGRTVLGPLAGMVGERERVILGGTVERADSAGMARFALTRVRVGSFDVPGPVVPRLVAALRKGRTGNALLVPLPEGVGDVRVSRGRVTLYRAAP
jgi:hypothetical protein